LSIIDPSNRAIAMYLYDGLIKVLYNNMYITLGIAIHRSKQRIAREGGVQCTYRRVASC